MEIVGDRRLVAGTLENPLSAPLASRRRGRVWGRDVGAAWVCACAHRIVEGRVGAFSSVVFRFARGLDSVGEGKVHPDAVDVDHFLSTIASGDCRTNRQ
eukprot:1241895-Pleurochrysis_carterae.AAC.1